jgi:hypothetical protein
MIEISLSLELVESLLCPQSSYYGSVMLLEIKESMQLYIAKVLVDGGSISLNNAFDHVWNELVCEETDISSDYKDTDDDLPDL